MRSLGIGARDVKTVVLTHFHIDHDGGLAHFADSRIFADGDEIARAAGIAGAIQGYLPSRWPTWFDPKPLAWQRSAYGPFARSAPITIAGDVIAVPTSGHTPSHVSVIVHDGSEQIMLAGDASYLETTMLRGAIDGVSPDETAARATLANIRVLCAASPTVYLPTHDPEAGERLAQRCPVAASNHASSDPASVARPIDRRSAIPIWSLGHDAGTLDAATFGDLHPAPPR